jgi:PA14 domain.
VSNFFTPEFNNESAIAPWNTSLEPIKAIIPQLDANRVLTGGIGQEVNIPTLTPEPYDNIILPDASLTRMASAVSTDSNSSLPDSSVDLLTGEAMSEVYGDLSKFAADPDLAAKLNVPFGENWDAGAAKTLAEAWFQGDFSDIPPVKVVSSAEIGGANGAFAAATDTIYLSKELLAGGDLGAIADVLREEIGHSVDVRLNVTDSPGDEGAIFGAVVQGKVLSEGELQGLKSEDDQDSVAIDGHQYLVEKQLSQWKAEYFNNINLTGTPVFSRGESSINYDWGNGGPGNGVRNDQFSARWTGSFNFQGGDYTFKQSVDDGMRVWVDNNLIHDTWNGRNAVDYSVVRNMTPGQHTVKVEYKEWTGAALAKVSWESTPPNNRFLAQFYNNTDLSGTPVFSRYDNSINYDWGTGGPGNGVKNDQFSARWTGSFNFEGGDYTFKESVDDGMRVWVDNNLIHDTWNGRNAVDYSRVVPMTPGQHTVKVEYKEWTDSALAKVSWDKGNPDIDIRLDFIGNFTQSQKNLIERAAQNWENIITKDMVPSGVLNVAVTDGSTHFNGNKWGSEWAITDFPYSIGVRPTPNVRYNLQERFDNTRGIDYDTEMQFKSSSLADVEKRGLLVRLAMHELGHALYLDEAQYDGNLGLDSLMDRDGIDPKITEGMYRELERMGYGVNRNPSINWS